MMLETTPHRMNVIQSLHPTSVSVISSSSSHMTPSSNSPVTPSHHVKSSPQDLVMPNKLSPHIFMPSDERALPLELDVGAP
jgi:hypothetical protein